MKLNIQNTKNMASGPITSWQIEGEKVEAATDLIFLGSKITADSDCSCEVKRHLLLGRKAMTNLDRVSKNRDITSPAKVCIVKAMTNLNSVLKSRDITVSTKIHIVKAMVHPVVMYRYESWIIKKPEHQTMNTFKLW